MTAAVARFGKTVLFQNAADLRAERTRSLPNRNLYLGDENIAVEPLGDFRRFGAFKEERQSFNEIGSRFFNRRALTRDVEFRTERNVPIALAPDYGGKSMRCQHDLS